VPAPAPRYTPSDLGFALAVVVIWGLNFVVMKTALQDFTPFQMGFFRYFFAAVPLVFFVRRPQLPWRWLVMFGLTQLGQFGLLFVALQVGMTAALASVLMQSQAFLTALLGVAWLNERIARHTAMGLALALAGLTLFVVNVLGENPSRAVTLTGLALNLGAALMWACANIVIRKAQVRYPAYDALQLTVWMSLIPILPFALMSWAFDPPEAHGQWRNASLAAWLGIAYLAWMATIAGYAMWTALLKRHAASRIAPFSLAVPLVGLLAGMMVLDEVVTPLQWAGSSLIVLALAVSTFGGRRER